MKRRWKETENDSLNRPEKKEKKISAVGREVNNECGWEGFQIEESMSLHIEGECRGFTKTIKISTSRTTSSYFRIWRENSTVMNEKEIDMEKAQYTDDFLSAIKNLKSEWLRKC